MTVAPSVGIDLVDVTRFRAVLARRGGLAERLFSDRERADAPRVESLAARFAAKEAVLKALGVGIGAARFREIEVHRASSGAPRLVLTGSARALADARGVRHWSVSLSHTDTMAAAMVVGS